MKLALPLAVALLLIVGGYWMMQQNETAGVAPAGGAGLGLGVDVAGFDTEVRPQDASAVREWADRRGRRTAHPDFALVVGHLDLLALPPGSV